MNKDRLQEIIKIERLVTGRVEERKAKEKVGREWERTRKKKKKKVLRKK